MLAYEKLHFGNLLVNLLHKLDDEVHQLMLQHLLGMEVGNQEGDIVALLEVRKPTCQFPLVPRMVL